MALSTAKSSDSPSPTSTTSAAGSTMSYADLLAQAHYNQIMTFMFTIVWMSVLMIIGFIGNVLTISFYWRDKNKSSAITLIIALAMVDFVVCILTAGTITDMFVNILFTNFGVCKFMYFIDHFTIVTSIWILWLISVDRYRKVCKPLLKQLTPRKALIGVGITAGISLVSSVRDFVTFEPVNVNISVAGTSVIGHYCTNTDKANLQLVVWVGHGFDAVFVMGVLCTFLFTYGNIWRTLHKHEKSNTAVLTKKNSPHLSRENVRISSSRTIDSSMNEEVELRDLKTPRNSSYPSNMNMLQVPDSRIRPVSDGDNISITSHKSKIGTSLSSIANIATRVKDKFEKQKDKISKTERNISLMMFAVSVGFLICFTPYFIVNIGIRLFTKTSEYELSGGVQFGLRSPFWNSVINPIIFCAFNPKYRRYIRAKLFSCGKDADVYEFEDSTQQTG